LAGFYIHIPFCKQACHYCNFYFSTSLKHKDTLISAILKEIDLRAKNWQNLNFETIYFGGGTPSILPIHQIEEILKKLYQKFNISNKPEITLEANPDDLNLEKLKAYKTMGINRLSIGIQSFFDDDLNKLNRSHNAQQAQEVIHKAQSVGFENITVDLIYGIPGLSDDKWQQNIQKVLDAKVPHISAYALTVEPKTALSWQITKGVFPPVSDEQAARQFKILQKILLANGFEHYEISNFGKPNCHSRHNTAYWQNKPYLGLGPAAHSYKDKQRRWNVANNAVYIKNIDTGNYYEIENLSPRDIYNETIMTGLRTSEGVSLKQITEIDQNFLKQLLKNSQKYIDNQQLALTETHLKPHPEALFLIEGIISDLFMI